MEGRTCSEGLGEGHRKVFATYISTVSFLSPVYVIRQGNRKSALVSALWPFSEPCSWM
jgi:hypothetical protein